jgi:hypothetical protein
MKNAFTRYFAMRVPPAATDWLAARKIEYHNQNGIKAISGGAAQDGIRRWHRPRMTVA